MASTSLKAVGAIGAAGVTAFSALTKSALDGVGSLEQNIGGVNKLFEDSADIVIKNSKKAFNTAGMSANEYMENVTGFAASLVSGLGGDTKKAAEIADIAIRDMSDNANTFGSDIESIKNAYQGFAKQNYTMLDNLKLGFGGSADGMAKLINKYGEFDGALEVTAQSVKDVPFDEMIKAIHNAQVEMNIAGTTSKEAADTIQGSMASAKAAWENFLSGAGSVDDFVSALTGAVGQIGKNLVEIVPRLAEGLSQLIEQLGPYIVPMVQELLPALTDGALALINGLLSNIPVLLPTLTELAIQIVSSIASTIAENGPEILEGLKGAFESIATSLTTMFPGLQPLVDSFKDIWESAGHLVDALIPLAESVFPILVSVAGSVFQAFEKLVSSISPLIESILPTLNTVIGFLVDHLDGVMAVVTAVVAGFMAFQTVEFVIGFIEGVQTAFAALNLVMSLNPISLIIGLIAALVAAFIYLWNNCDEFRQFWIDLWEGIKETFTSVWDAISGFFTETIPQAWENFKTSLKQGIDNIIEWFVSLPSRIQSFFEELPYKLGEMLGTLIAHIVNFTINTNKFIIEFIAELFNRAVEFFTTLPQRTAEFVTNLMAKVEDLKTKIVNKTKEIIDSVIEWVKTLPERIMVKLTEIKNQVIAFKNLMINKAKETADNFVKNLVDGIKELPDKFKESAHNVVEGFINGIKEKIQSAKDAIKDFADGIFSGFNKNLDIHSPSKKFEWSAEMCLAGFEKPFEGYNPYSALTDGAKATANSLKASIVGAVGNPAGLDMSGIGGIVKNALQGMAVMIDGRTAGMLLAQPVNEALGTFATRRV